MRLKTTTRTLTTHQPPTVSFFIHDALINSVYLRSSKKLSSKLWTVKQSSNHRLICDVPIRLIKLDFSPNFATSEKKTHPSWCSLQKLVTERKRPATGLSLSCSLYASTLLPPMRFKALLSVLPPTQLHVPLSVQRPTQFMLSTLPNLQPSIRLPIQRESLPNLQPCIRLPIQRECLPNLQPSIRLPIQRESQHLHQLCGIGE